MAITLKEFASQLDDSGVISAAEIATFQESQSPAAESAEDLAKLLVKHKKVTKLQAKLVFQGKGKQLLLGDYLILDKIGAGGMGDVYLAEHRRMERRVALKTLPTAMTKDAQSIQRFQREVKAAAKLTHPNIVTAHDAGEDKNIHYFVMEYVEGIDLSAVVKKQGVLKVDVAVDYILQAAKGLKFAHNKGVIHRDIKPANMLLDNEATIKILDMGLARIEDEAHEIPATQLTQDGSVMGTVDYMAPEQAKDTHTADARSDIYSLGCSLYYLLTGESVYRGSTMVNRIMAHQNDPIPSLTGKHILISQDVDAVFQKMVAKKPEDRFQSMSEVIVAIENCIQMKSSSTVSTEPSDPELQKFLQSQKVASSPTVVMSADAMTAEKSLSDTQETPTSDFLNHTLNGTSFQPLPKRKKSIRKRGWIAVGTVLASLILLAGIVLKVDTSEGTIILEIDQPELAGAVVSVDEQQKITIKTGKGEEPITVKADKKTHILKVTKGGFETFTKQFTVKAGGKEAIKVRLEALKVVKKTPAGENYALEFSGDASVVVDDFSYDGSEPITMEVWFDPSENIDSSIVALNSIKTVNLWVNPNFKMWGGQVFDDKEILKHGFDFSKKQLNVSGRVHFALTYDKNYLRLFLNGKSVGKSHIGNFLPHKYKKGNQYGLNKLFFVNHPNVRKNQDHRMRIFACRVSNIARYEKDFTPAKRFENDKHTMALYHFDEGSGYILKDSSGNGRDGKIVGAKWVNVDDELQVVKPASTGDTPMTDREVAEWVLGLGGHVQIGSRIIAAIKQLPTTPFVIDRVKLAGTSMRDDDLKRLAGLKNLEGLSLDKTLISDAGVQYLKNIPLRFLSLINTQITDKGLGYLSNMPSLTAIYVGSTGISNSGVEQLKDMKQLEKLSLGNTQIDDVGLEYLAGLTNLEHLTIHLTQITDSGLKHLKEMKKLSFLTIGNTLITNAGLKELVGLTNLEELHIANSKISDSGLEHLKDLKSLQDLILDSTSITDTGLKHLHGLKMLENLNLTKTKVTPQGIASLQKALPNCKILSDFGTKPPITVNNPHRRAAELVLRRGGSVIIHTPFSRKKITDFEKLPQKRFALKSVASYNKKPFSDSGWKVFDDIESLRSMVYTGLPISDAGIKQIKKIDRLFSLTIENSQLTDTGLAQLSKLSDLQELQIIGKTSITETTFEVIADIIELRTLEMSFNKNANLTTGFKKLSQLPHLRQLSLIGSNGLTNSMLADLRPSKSLQFLNLRNTNVDDEAIDHLAKISSLRMLHLGETKVSNEAVTRLQKLLPNCSIIHPAIPTNDADLRAAQWVVDNGGKVLTPTAASSNARLDSERIPQEPFSVSSIILDPNSTAKTGVKNLEGLRCIRNLELSGITNADTQLASIRKLTSLYGLKLNGLDVSTAGLEHLTELHQLDRLILSDCMNLTDDAFAHLASFQDLWICNLTGTPISDDGLAHIGKLKNLQVFYLDDCPSITGSGFNHLVTLPRLHMLSIIQTPVTDEAIPHLQQMKSLRILNITGTKITAAAAAKLQAALPKCVIFHESLNDVPWQATAKP